MTITVLQWNVWVQEDIQNIANFLKQQKVDVMCLQELTSNYPKQHVRDTPAFISEQLGYNYYYKNLPIKSVDGEKIMLASGIFSRFPIIRSRYTLTNRPESSDDGEYRAYVEATITVDDKEINIGTSLMSYTHGFETTPNKVQETQHLLQELNKHKVHYVFTGDLNAAPDSPTAQSINKILRNAGPRFAEKTWTTKPFSHEGFEETKLNWRLDYIFVSKDIQTVSSEVLQTEYSDHLPVLVKLEMNG